MEIIYLFFVALLVVLAVSDLVVGVSNDAVNFLNSAVGSKAAPFRIILLVASIGIIIGATFSSGMMDIARNGVFHPDKFVFKEVMFIFLAVMITDIILLDLFNTFGLPTSTTVSMVFELLGASVGVVLYKISASQIQTIGDYINTDKVLAIVSGILISVVVSFLAGSIIQYFTRILFTFDFKKTYRRFGAVFGGLAVTIVVYFLLMKGAKGASFITSDMLKYLMANSFKILIVNFIVWTALFQILILTTRVNIFRIVILAGTFALAMAFAGNDLVNFIGVPMAGLESYKHYAALHTDAARLSVDFLSNPVKSSTLYLLVAGVIMSLTLAFSRKARTVTQTEISLSNQNTGAEKFESSVFARNIVRFAISIGNTIYYIFPKPLKKWINSRFIVPKKIQKIKKEEQTSFDLLRGSVNLVVSSVLIASATSLKLPLSTTYVTFMVAMGSALADGAWDRESAVYRVSGVITVIGGWFFTAFSAFTLALIVALIISWGGTFAVAGLVVLLLFIVVRFYKLHKKIEDKKQIRAEEELAEENLSMQGIFDQARNTSVTVILSIAKYFFLIFNGLSDEKRKKLKKVKTEISEFKKNLDDKRNNIYLTISKFQDESVETAHHYIQVSDYINQATKDLSSLADYVYNYIDNNHAPLKHGQVSDLKSLSEELSQYLNVCVHYIKNSRFDYIYDLEKKQLLVIELVSKIRKKTLKQIKKQDISTKNSLLYLRILSESENIVHYVSKLMVAESEMFSVVKSNRQSVNL